MGGGTNLRSFRGAPAQREPLILEPSLFQTAHLFCQQREGNLHPNPIIKQTNGPMKHPPVSSSNLVPLTPDVLSW